MTQRELTDFFRRLKASGFVKSIASAMRLHDTRAQHHWHDPLTEPLVMRRHRLRYQREEKRKAALRATAPGSMSGSCPHGMYQPGGRGTPRVPAGITNTGLEEVAQMMLSGEIPHEPADGFVFSPETGERWNTLRFRVQRERAERWEHRQAELRRTHARVVALTAEMFALKRYHLPNQEAFPLLAEAEFLRPTLAELNPKEPLVVAFDQAVRHATIMSWTWENYAHTHEYERICRAERWSAAYDRQTDILEIDPYGEDHSLDYEFDECSRVIEAELRR